MAHMMGIKFDKKVSQRDQLKWFYENDILYDYQAKIDNVFYMAYKNCYHGIDWGKVKWVKMELGISFLQDTTFIKDSKKQTKEYFQKIYGFRDISKIIIDYI